MYLDAIEALKINQPEHPKTVINLKGIYGFSVNTTRR